VELPNQTVTWGRDIESYDVWLSRQTSRFSETAGLLMYLTDQLRCESADLSNVRFSNPVLGLMSYFSETNNRAAELMFAYLALTLTRDAGPARALVAGQRLHKGLHPEYVAKTKCYG